MYICISHTSQINIHAYVYICIYIGFRANPALVKTWYRPCDRRLHVTGAKPKPGAGVDTRHGTEVDTQRTGA